MKMNRRRMLENSLALVTIPVSCGAGLLKAAPDISAANLRFVEYPGFPEAHSTWGSIGYSSKFDRVLIGVTNHRDRIALYEYDAQRKEMTLSGFIPELARLRQFQWQGKIHSEILEGPDGGMYFSTDGGESREEYLMNHPHGYRGGFFFRWDPGEQSLINLGMGLPYESIKDIAINRKTGEIYAISYPQVHFLVYDPAGNDLRDLGRLGSDHVPRVVFSDWWGNGYYVDWRQRLVKYEAVSERLLFASESLPEFPGTPGSHIVTGITAYAADSRRGVIYLITYGAKLIAFYPSQQGIGTVEDLGGIAETAPGVEWRPYCPNLALAGNGKLYFFVGGHGIYAERDTILLTEFDPETKVRRVVMRFPLSKVTEVTGSNVRDRRGNLYFAGVRRDVEAQRRGESGATRPFMIIFNPQKILS